MRWALYGATGQWRDLVVEESGLWLLRRRENCRSLYGGVLPLKLPLTGDHYGNTELLLKIACTKRADVSSGGNYSRWE